MTPIELALLSHCQTDKIALTEMPAYIEMQRQKILSLILENRVIKQQKSGSHAGVWYFYYHGRHYYGRSVTEVEDRLIEAYLHMTDDTIDALMSRVIADSHVSPNTLCAYKVGLSYLGDLAHRRLSQMTLLDLKTALEEIAVGLSYSQWQKARTVLYKVCKRAQLEGYDIVDIREAVGLMELERTAHQRTSYRALERAMTEDDTERMIRYCLDHPSASRLAIALCLVTGLRAGELVALQVDDITGDTLHVCREEIEDHHNHRMYDVDHCKTQSGTRDVYLSSRAMEIIQVIKAYKKASSIYLFEGRAGHIHTAALRTECIDLCEALSLPYRYSMHDMRRTYASIAYRRCGDGCLTWLQGQLGHRRASQTLEYIHDVCTCDDHRAYAERATVCNSDPKIKKEPGGPILLRFRDYVNVRHEGIETL